MARTRRVEVCRKEIQLVRENLNVWKSSRGLLSHINSDQETAIERCFMPQFKNGERETNARRNGWTKACKPGRSR